MQNIIYEPSANDQEDKKLSPSIKLKAIYSLIKNRWSRRRALGLIALISATILALQLLGISLNNFYNYIEPLTTKINQLSDNANWITWVALLALVSYLTYLLKPLGKRCIGYFRECYVEYEKLVKSFVINLTEEKPIGFVTDTPEEEKLDIGWRDYCSTIVSTLEATDLSKDCFAIGISGGWGSGKTTFLKELQAQLKENPSYMLIEYNPWNTGNKSDIVENFFKTFSSLVGHRSSLYPHLQRYARALSDVGGINWEALTNIFIPEKTLDELKEQINQSVLNSRKRYVFFIDDLDRLDKEEIFEVLKLIRASANFKNTIFIVAYDPDYIENMLKELGVTEPLIYLQKIFNLELSLPSFEKDGIPKLLKRELIRLCGAERLEEINEIVDYVYGDKYLVTYFISNFRDVQRFINLFTTNYIQTSINLKEDFCLKDLFWLEALHYGSPQVYNNLRDNRSRYLQLEQKDLHQPAILVPNSNTKALQVFETRVFYILFHNDTQNLGHSYVKLRYQENYPKYFSLRALNGQISNQEFYNLVTSTDSYETILKQTKIWSGKTYIDSFSHHLNAYSLSDKSTQERMNYLQVLATCIKLNSSLDILLHIFVNKIASWPSDLEADVMKPFILNLMSEHIRLHWEFSISTNILKMFLSLADWDDGTREVQNPILGIEEMKSLTSELFDLKLRELGDQPISAILTPKSELNLFLSKMKVRRSGRLENLLFEDLIRYYSLKSIQYSLYDFLTPLILSKEKLSVSDEINKIFGNYEDCKQFTKACLNAELPDNVEKITLDLFLPF